MALMHGFGCIAVRRGQFIVNLDAVHTNDKPPVSYRPAV